MYYEEQWVNGALCWRTDPAGVWIAYTSYELGHRYQAELKRAADAQATVEALQRERDEWRSNAVAQEVRANDLERDCKDLLSDIDGERAKVGNLLKKIAYWEKRHLTYRELAEENMNLKSDELSALQGLVRALPVVRIDLNGAYHDTLLAQPEDEAVKELLRYRASLDATTPAATIGEQCSYCQKPLTTNHSFSYGFPGVPRVYKCDRTECIKPKGGNGE